MNISLEKSIAAHFFDISERPYNANNKISKKTNQQWCTMIQTTQQHNANGWFVLCLAQPVWLFDCKSGVWRSDCWYSAISVVTVIARKLHSIGKNVSPNRTMLHILLSHSFLPLNLGNNEIADNWTCHLRRYLCLLRRIWIIIGWCFNSPNCW